MVCENCKDAGCEECALEELETQEGYRCMKCEGKKVSDHGLYCEMRNKFILDCCCGGRMMWFEKRHINAIYTDIRTLPKDSVKDRPNFEVKPDIIMDFTKLDFPNECFKLVVYDPPHLKSLGKNSWMAKKYGVVDTYHELEKGFKECWRVLEDYGVLIFKWSTETEKRSMSISKIIKLFGEKPLFGHTSGSKSNTHWVCFMKIPGGSK